MIRACAVVAALVLSIAGVMYAQSPKFTPPRLLKAELPPMPPPTIAGAGEVLIEAIVDRTGALGRPVILRGTPPYTQMVFDASRRPIAPSRWPVGCFEPHEMPITIAVSSAARPSNHGRRSASHRRLSSRRSRRHRSRGNAELPPRA